MVFDIPGKVTGKGRPRFNKKGYTYTPEQTASYENWVKMCYLRKYAKVKLDGEVRVVIEAFFKVPKSTNKKDRELIAQKLKLPTKKPDIDNIIKIILDSLNGLAWNDDTQVTDLVAYKRYTSGEPKVVVTIDELFEGVKRDVSN